MSVTLDYNPPLDYDPSLYHTVGSLAELWGCPESAIYYLLRSKRLKGFKAGVAWKIPDRARYEYEQRYNGEE